MQDRQYPAPAADDAQTYELPLTTRDGVPYTGRITGERVISNSGCDVYVTADRRVIVYDTRHEQHHVLDDLDLLHEWVDDDERVAVLVALGEPVVIDL